MSFANVERLEDGNYTISSSWGGWSVTVSSSEAKNIALSILQKSIAHLDGRDLDRIEEILICEYVDLDPVEAHRIVKGFDYKKLRQHFYDSING